FVPVVQIAPLVHPVCRDLLQQLSQGHAFPPGFALQFSFLLGGNAPAVNLIFHALQCSAKCNSPSIFPTADTGLVGLCAPCHTVSGGPHSLAITSRRNPRLISAFCDGGPRAISPGGQRPRR